GNFSFVWRTPSVGRKTPPPRRCSIRLTSNASSMRRGRTLHARSMRSRPSSKPKAMDDRTGRRVMPSVGIPPNSSASQLTTYAVCGRRYFFRYILNAEPEFRSPALAFGSALHSTIDWWFAERLNGRTPTIAQAEQIVEADLQAECVGDVIRWGKT